MKLSISIFDRVIYLYSEKTVATWAYNFTYSVTTNLAFQGFT